MKFPNLFHKFALHAQPQEQNEKKQKIEGGPPPFPLSLPLFLSHSPSLFLGPLRSATPSSCKEEKKLFQQTWPFCVTHDSMRTFIRKRNSFSVLISEKENLFNLSRSGYAFLLFSFSNDFAFAQQNRDF
jgi:hypothetical protein